MPGQNPLRLPPEFDRLVVKFHQEHGELPVLVLLPQELRPGEALSWDAYFALGGDLPGVPGCPDPAATRLTVAQAIGEEKAPAGAIGPGPGKR